MNALRIVCNHRMQQEMIQLKQDLQEVTNSCNMWKQRYIDFLHKDDYRLHDGNQDACFLCGCHKNAIGLYESKQLITKGCESCVSRWVTYGMKLNHMNHAYIIDDISYL